MLAVALRDRLTVTDSDLTKFDMVTYVGEQQVFLGVSHIPSTEASWPNSAPKLFETPTDAHTVYDLE